MSRRLNVLCKILKAFYFILKYCGFIQFRYCRAKQQWLYERRKALRFLPTTLVFILFGYCKWLFLSNLEQVTIMESLGAQPKLEYEEFHQKFDAYKIIYAIVPLWSLWKCNELWHLINQSQIAYKHLKNLWGKRFYIDFSWPLMVNGLLLLILIMMFCLKTIFLDYPNVESELPEYKSYKLCEYILEISKIIFLVILAVRLYYHLLHAGLCESLNRLKLNDNPLLIQGLLQVLPYLRRMNYLAGYYFRISYICFYILVCTRSIDFIRLLKIDDNEYLENQKSLEDMEQEAEWAGKESENVKLDRPLTEAAIILAWHLGIWILLLSAANLQQIAYENFMDNLWSLEFPNNSEEMKGTSERNIEFWRAKKDIINLMINSGISLEDYRSNSISFNCWKSKKIFSYINLDFITGSCKLFLNVLIFSMLVYMGQQMELANLIDYYKNK